MKNKFKSITSVLSVLVLLMSFCGCSTMQELCSDHAYYKEGTTDTVIYQGEEFYLLPYKKYFSPNVDYSRDYIYLTEANEPLLLKDICGQTMDITLDGTILCDGSGFATYYCRSDCYDAITKRLTEEIAFDHYCFEYTAWDESDTNGTTAYYLLSDAQAKMIDNIMSANNSDIVEWKKFQTEEITLICTIAICSDDMLFKIPAISVWKHDGYDAYYISDGAYSYTAYQEYDGSPTEYVYKVDDQYNHELLKMLESVL